MIPLLRIIQEATGATRISDGELLQSLWSGYGTITRYRLQGGSQDSVIVKHVAPPSHAFEPNTLSANRSHQRKQRSYEVETCWYREWSMRCGKGCYVPQCLAVHAEGDECLIVLEDLVERGFSKRKPSLSRAEMDPCLKWLANFHCTFLGEQPRGLWPQGSYWHLETRPDELQVLNDEKLKQAAAEIDQRLRAAKFQTIIHGDAKLDNFCFTVDGQSVAAVDFQYVGGGCGVIDVAYFIGSCLEEKDCERYAEDCLNLYLGELRSLLMKNHPAIDPNELCTEWEALFPFAWADFHRFLKGWSPGYWKPESYSERICQAVLATVKVGH